MKPIITRVQVPTSTRPARYTVVVDNLIVGMLEKYTDTCTDKHPWKAILGTGYTARFLKAFYPKDGGKEAAIAHILEQVK